MKSGPILARLKDLEGLRSVQGAASLDKALSQVPAARPAAYVVPLSETRSGERYAAGGIGQSLIWNFGIVLIADEASDARGGRAAEGLEPIRQTVVRRLSTWVHPEAASHCRSTGGRLLALKGATLFWLQQFAAEGDFEADDVEDGRLSDPPADP